jgi:anti-sigma factor RsiW
MEAVRQIPPRRPFWLPRRPLWNAARVIAMAATAACLFLIGFLSGRGFPVAAPPDEAMPLPAGAQKLNVELLGVRHQGVLAAPPSTEVALASARQQAEALSRRAELPVKAVDLKNLGARLVALDVTEVQGVPVAHLCYLWNDTPVSLFQVDARRLVSPTLRQPHVGPCYILREVGGLRYVVWCVGMTNYALVARARPEELMKMADYARRQLELL